MVDKNKPDHTKYECKGLLGECWPDCEPILDWDDLPLKNGEDSHEWNNLMARYSHVGCPGLQYEDNCAAPWDCAVKGMCRISFEKRRKT